MAKFDQETLRKLHDSRKWQCTNHEASRKRRHHLDCGFKHRCFHTFCAWDKRTLV